MKRIVICADGTWNSPETETATNVLRLARGVAPRDGRGRKQVVFYDWGVGSDRKQLTGGVSGAGIDKNIMDCYRFIVHNYDAEDELLFFGFSRGAYTVRSLAGFIRNCGLLRREHAARIPAAYTLYRKRTRNSHPDAPDSVRFRRDHSVADRTTIRFIGVWDTVGALGIPMPFLGTLGDAKFLFHDCEPSSIVRCARHAVSLDEDREDFTPTLWTAKPGLDLRQVWFPGVHSDVGGGYEQTELSDIAFRWMLDEAAGNGLRFEDHLTGSLKPDPLAPQHNEYRGIFRLRKRFIRDPAIDAQPILHRSARLRWQHADARARSKALKKLLDHLGGAWDRVNLID